MAKWLPSALISDIRGRLRGDVFSYQHRVHYIRSHCASPYNPNTYRQQQVRNWMTVISNSWSALTAGERALWNQYGSLMHPGIDGFPAYVKMNMRWAALSISPTAWIRTPPKTVDTPPRLVGLTCTRISSTRIRLHWDLPSDAAARIVAWFRKNWDYSPTYTCGWSWAGQAISNAGEIFHDHAREAGGTIYFYRVRVIDTSARYSPMSEIQSLYT